MVTGICGCSHSAMPLRTQQINVPKLVQPRPAIESQRRPTIHVKTDRSHQWKHGHRRHKASIAAVPEPLDPGVVVASCLPTLEMATINPILTPRLPSCLTDGFLRRSYPVTAIIAEDHCASHQE